MVIFLLIIPMVGLLLNLWLRHLTVYLVSTSLSLIVTLSLLAMEKIEYAGIINLWVDRLGLIMLIISNLLMFLIVPINTRLKFNKMSARNSSVEGGLEFFNIQALLMLQFCLNLIFSAQNLWVLFIGFELSLLPLLFMLGFLGSENKIQALKYLFIYTLAGGLLLLGSLLILQYRFNSLDLKFLYASLGDKRWTFNGANWVFWLSFFAFAIKMPLFPLSHWLPLAHVESPTVASMLLSGIMLKIAAYGWIKISLSCVPLNLVVGWHIPMILASLSILWGGFLAYKQRDLKKIIAYSSISHMGMATLGIFMPVVSKFGLWNINMLNLINREDLLNNNLSNRALQGGVILLISHALVAPLSFLLVGLLYKRLKTRDINVVGGLKAVMPKYSFALLFAVMANLGIPGTMGFLGELLCIYGLLGAPIYALFAALAGLLLNTIFSLNLYKKVATGAVKLGMLDLTKESVVRPGLGLENTRVEAASPVCMVKDISGYEQATLYGLIFLSFLGGVYLDPVIKKFNIDYMQNQKNLGGGKDV